MCVCFSASEGGMMVQWVLSDDPRQQIQFAHPVSNLPSLNSKLKVLDLKSTKNIFYI